MDMTGEFFVVTDLQGNRNRLQISFRAAGE